MTTKEKHELIVGGLLLALLLWVLWHVMHKAQPAQQQSQQSVPAEFPNLSVQSFPPGNSSGNGISCGCEVECQTTAFSLPNTAAKIAALGNAADAQIVAMGNGTLLSLADLARSEGIAVDVGQ